MFELTPEQLFAFAVSGIVLSALFEYFPKFGDWFNALPDNQQRLLVLGSGLGVVLGTFGLSCFEYVVLPWVCASAGLYDALLAFVAFIIANQATYLVLPRRARRGK